MTIEATDTSSLHNSILVLLATTVCLVVLYYAYYVSLWFRGICQIGRQVDKLPGDDTHWLYGNLHQHPGICGATMPWLVERCTKHGGRAFRMWFGPFRPSVGLCHPDTLRLILKTSEPKTLQGNGAYSLVRPWLGDGLLISSGAKWYRNRKLMTAAFHFDVLKNYIRVNNEAVDILLDKWMKELNENGKDKSIEIFESVSLCTLDIILRCAFSYTGSTQEAGSNNVYVNYVMSLSQMIMQRAFKIHWYIDWLYYKTAHGKEFSAKCDYVHMIADNIIKQRKQILEKNPDVAGTKHKDFLDILLLARDESGVGMTDLEIRNEVDTFLFEGHDTTASAISWCLYNLASHRDIQNKARLEVEGLVENRMNTNYITWEDVDSVPYLTMCVKESLRLHPPVPFVGRDLTQPLEVEGVTLLPGTIIDIIIYVAHHNPLVWGEDHMDYKPERFEPEKVKNMDSHAFIPFSAGPRNCIGQSFALHEIKVVVARILLRYELEVDRSHPVEMMPEIILRARNGLKLFFVPRVQDPN